MAFTLAMYNMLQAAYASGARSVYYGDKRVDYNTPAEMAAALNTMGIELGLIKPNKNRQYARFNSGLNNGCDDFDR